MELRNVRAFISVAQLLSFRRAAKVLHYAQSTVSAQVQALEEELGARLFDRLDRSIRLTEAGSRFLPYALRLIELAEESVCVASGTEGGKGALIVRMPETLATYRFPEIFGRFRRACPNVFPSLRGGSVHGLPEILEKGLDLAFVLAEGYHAPRIRAERLGAERMVLAASPDHPLAAEGTIPPERLEGEVVHAANSDNSCLSLLEGFLADRGVALRAGVGFGSVAALKACLTAAGGLAVLPEAAVREEADAGRLAILDVEGAPREIGRFMLWHEDKWLSATLSRLMDMVREAWGRPEG